MMWLIVKAIKKENNFFFCSFYKVYDSAFQISLKKRFRSGNLSISFGFDRQLFQKQGLLRDSVKAVNLHAYACSMIFGFQDLVLVQNPVKR